MPPNARNADGTLETAFDPNFNAEISALALQSDGKIVAGGLFTALNPVGAPSVTTNLDSNGNLKYHTDFRQVYASVLDSWLGADSQQVLGYPFANLGLFDGPPSDAGAISAHPLGVRTVQFR